MSSVRIKGLPVPLGGVVTDPAGVRYAVVSVSGDRVVLRCHSADSSRTWTLKAVKGVPLRCGEFDVIVSDVLEEEGKRPWIVLGAA
jgi:hypothetical protein